VAGGDLFIEMLSCSFASGSDWRKREGRRSALFATPLRGSKRPALIFGLFRLRSGGHTPDMILSRKATFQAGSPKAPELSAQPQLTVRRASRSSCDHVKIISKYATST
jgi:hypothetical protein